MSRVHEALKIADRNRTGQAPAVESVQPTTEESPLKQFRSEGRSRLVAAQAPAPAQAPPPAAAPAHAPEPAAPSEPAVESTPAFRPAPNARRARAAGKLKLNDAERSARLITGTSSTVSLEQYRRLAAVLHEEQEESKLKTVMVTSALPHEGKTLTIVNIALTLSESFDRSVLLIDADLRVPSLHTALGIENGPGLSEALRDEHLDIPFTPVSEGLTVLTAGKPGAKPLAGLTSSRMAEVLKTCAEQFDWVLIDTSPVGVLPDAQVLARLVDGVVLVIGAGSTPADAVERAVAELGGPDVIIGTVLNRVAERRIPDAGYYGQYGNSSTSR